MCCCARVRPVSTTAIDRHEVAGAQGRDAGTRPKTGYDVEGGERLKTGYGGGEGRAGPATDTSSRVGRDPTWSPEAEQVKWTVSMYLRENEGYNGRLDWREAHRNYQEPARAAATEARTAGRTYDQAGYMDKKKCEDCKEKHRTSALPPTARPAGAAGVPRSQGAGRRPTSLLNSPRPAPPSLELPSL